ncbi:MAG: hypothetical protein Q8J96_15870, partial [Rhodocyclaceae bacterium]|nr:hypothetical protein [Rhodocyclaceae bacterium]
MGMFDYLKCKYPLPDAGDDDLEYQTKDTPAQFLDNYEIRADGSLWHLDYDIEDRSDPNADGLARLVGRLSRVNERWEPVPFTGEIRFYCYVGENQCTEFSAYFVNGMLNFLTPIGKEPMSVNGARQGSCRLGHAANGWIWLPIKCVFMMASRSGLSVTAPMGSQLRVSP